MATVDPTLVSNFEVLFTPQLPPGIGPKAATQIDEYVIKGFFLTLSNPNSATYTFTVGFHCNVNPSPPPVQRTLASAVGFLDDGATGIPLTINPGGTASDFSVDVSVSPFGTLLIGILPAFFNGTGLVTPAIEVRGWTDIRLPALLKISGSSRFPLIEFVPQSATPVRIVATPEERLTFLPIPGDVASAVEAQSAFALPLAHGMSSFTVPPQPGGPLFGPGFAEETSLSERDIAALTTLLRASPGAHAAALAALVASAPAIIDGKSDVQKVLGELGVPSPELSTLLARS
jgi:hypothetical protein